jgi:UDP-N-acetylglucosamine 2-epimerase (non-hydrolysing)
MSKKKIITVVGARPQFIKCAALSPHLRNYFNEVIVHTGQHYDQNLSDNFFKELNIPTPNYNLNANESSGVEQIADIMVKLNKIVQQEKPLCMIVFGDTNSTAAAAIVAAKNNIKIAHIEAGMREFDKSIPEETNKLITDILCDYYFCPTPTAVRWLGEMGITQHVYHTGDIMIDLIETFRTQIESNTSIFNRFGLVKKQYVFATCHREANTNNTHNLEEILNALTHIDLPVLLPLHPRTRKAIQQFGLAHYLNSGKLITCEPLGYIDTQALMMHAYVVITDSGGVTKECYYHGVPGIITDKQTEWIETVQEGWNVQAGPFAQKILKAYTNLNKPLHKGHVLGQADAAAKIAQILNDLLNQSWWLH